MQCFVDAAEEASKFNDGIAELVTTINNVETTKEYLKAIEEANADFDYYGGEIYFEFRIKSWDDMWYDFHMEDVKPYAIGFVVLLLMILVTALAN